MKPAKVREKGEGYEGVNISTVLYTLHENRIMTLIKNCKTKSGGKRDKKE
jgi:hypothetical protein